MLSLTIEDKDITIRDIDKGQLPKIVDWFYGDNNSHYRYAMGMDRPITIDDLYEKYLEVLTNTREFFLSININKKFIGFIKGRADYRHQGEIWIMSMVIDELYQNNGIGKRVLKLIMDEFSERLGITKFYTCLVNDNDRAKSFWRHNGFYEYRSTKGYFTIDNKSYDLIIMHK